FAEMLGVRERLPDPGRRVGEVADENERPLLSIFSDLGAKGGARRVLLAAAHVFLPFPEGTFSIFSNCCSRASTCFDQKRRKGTSHASSSISGSGRRRYRRRCASIRDATNPASRSTRRCLETDGCDSRSSCSISPTERSDERSRLKMARRLGSATMANDDSTRRIYPCRYM